MGDLVAFLKARLDEDEAAANAAPGERWQSFTEDDIAGASVYDDQWLLLNPAHYDHDNPLSNKPGATGPQYIQRARNELAAHIARHDPARVLREVAAKRAILELHKVETHYVESRDDDYRPIKVPDVECHVCGWASDVDGSGCETLRIVASVYRDHPDYRAEWKP